MTGCGGPIVRVPVPAQTPVLRVPVPAVPTMVREIGLGPQGPAAPVGQDALRTVQQTAPSASWVIPHSFGRRPRVAVYDDDGQVIYPDIVAGLTVVSIIFAQPATGSATLS